MERGDILALMSLLEVRYFRQEKHGDPNRTVPRQAYIFRSLKHPEEVGVLREIYGRLFFLISAYSPKSKREDMLKRIIARSHGDSDEEKYREMAVHLINRDEEEEGTKLGQDVSDAFPLADLFLHTVSRPKIRNQISRFVDAIFGNPFLTPTKPEMGMYLARSAAFRSADLSRQVGAAICDDEGEVLAIGCNEVPKAFGGSYWPSDEHDDRDFMRGIDSSVEYKKSILQEIIKKFKEKGLLSEKIDDQELKKLKESIESGEFQELLSGGQIFDLLEFGRPVHAEMSAITSAARRGVSIQNKTLYCTTFPCHLCARLIIASGIKKVIYIEPYPKSKVKDLYSDSICVDPESKDPKRVNFLPFEGIAPRRYQELFGKPKRKNDDGSAIKWRVTKDKSPRVRRLILSYSMLEQKIVAGLGRSLNEKSFSLVTDRLLGKGEEDTDEKKH